MGCDMKGKEANQPKASPTPEDIWGPGGATERIQATWSDYERSQRDQCPPVPVIYPVSYPTYEIEDESTEQSNG